MYMLKKGEVEKVEKGAVTQQVKLIAEIFRVVT